jgi:hypothetical protein
MSDAENFLARWSRRKLTADEEPRAEEAEPQVVPAPEPPAPVAAEGEERAVAQTDEAEPPAVDLSALPSIESITAETDIRAFLQPGIPLQLTRAALRRVWSADPAIRDFIGLAENAWDFTAPDGVPGFGPLQPNDIARLTVAQVAEEIAPDGPSAVAEPLRNREVSAPRAAPGPAAAEEAPASDAAGPDQNQHSAGNDAAQKEQAAVDRETSVPPRHGGALPR